MSMNPWMMMDRMEKGTVRCASGKNRGAGPVRIQNAQSEPITTTHRLRSLTIHQFRSYLFSESSIRNLKIDNVQSGEACCIFWVRRGMSLLRWYLVA